MGAGVQPRGYSLVRALSPGPVFATLLARRDLDGLACVVKRVARGGAEAREQLTREAEILHAIRATGSAPRLVEYGTDAQGPFVVMQHIASPTLAAIGRPREAARLARALFEALAAIHDAADAQGALAIVHGDIAPTNAYVDEARGIALFGDFALARWRSGSPPADGAFRGTLLYAAPELARGEAIDARADLFALTASLLHATTGTPPRAGASFAVLLAEAAESPVAAYEVIARAAFSGPLAEALLACIAFDRRGRPSSAREVVNCANRSI